MNQKDRSEKYYTDPSYRNKVAGYNKKYYEKNKAVLRERAVRRHRNMTTKKPVTVTILGTDYEAFPIGELARRLNRSTQTIRKWEKNGVIPESLRDDTGKRLYLVEHIEAVVRAANESKIEPGQSLADSGFPARIKKEFNRIAKTLRENGGNNG